MITWLRFWHWLTGRKQVFRSTRYNATNLSTQGSTHTVVTYHEVQS